MRKFLASLAFAGMALSAPLAAESETIDIQYADLDLSTEAGVKTLESRIDKAARRTCGLDEKGATSRIPPRSRVRCAKDAKAAAMKQFAAVIEQQRKGG